jgi:hypothetical protein
MVDTSTTHGADVTTRRIRSPETIRQEEEARTPLARRWFARARTVLSRAPFRTLAALGDVAVALPTLDGDVASWALPSSAEDLAGQAFCLVERENEASSRSFVHTCARIGTALRLLHDTAGTPNDAQEVTSVPLQEEIAALLCGETNVAKALAGGALAKAMRSLPRATGPTVPLHGDLCLARVWLAPAGSALLEGWLEAGWGPRELDVGHFLAELLELHALADAHRNTCAGTTLRQGATRFLAAYGASTLNRDLLAAFSAAKILRHAARFERLYGARPDATAAFLALADEALHHQLTRWALFATGVPHAR